MNCFLFPLDEPVEEYFTNNTSKHEYDNDEEQ